MAVDMGRLGLHGLVRSVVGVGAGSVARHCAHELIFAWGAALVTDRDDNFYVCRQSRRGSWNFRAIPSFKESLHAEQAVTTRGVTGRKQIPPQPEFEDHIWFAIAPYAAEASAPKSGGRHPACRKILQWHRLHDGFFNPAKA